MLRDDLHFALNERNSSFYFRLAVLFWVSFFFFPFKNRSRYLLAKEEGSEKHAQLNTGDVFLLERLWQFNKNIVRKNSGSVAAVYAVIKPTRSGSLRLVFAECRQLENFIPHSLLLGVMCVQQLIRNRCYIVSLLALSMACSCQGQIVLLPSASVTVRVWPNCVCWCKQEIVCS